MKKQETVTAEGVEIMLPHIHADGIIRIVRYIQ